MLSADEYFQEYIMQTRSCMDAARDLLMRAEDLSAVDRVIYILCDARQIGYAPDDLAQLEDRYERADLLTRQRQRRVDMSPIFFDAAALYAFNDNLERAVAACRLAAFDYDEKMTPNDLVAYHKALGFIGMDSKQSDEAKLSLVLGAACDFFVGGTADDRREWAHKLLRPENRDALAAPNTLIREHGRWKDPVDVAFLRKNFAPLVDKYSGAAAQRPDLDRRRRPGNPRPPA